MERNHGLWHFKEKSADRLWHKSAIGKPAEGWGERQREAVVKEVELPDQVEYMTVGVQAIQRHMDEEE